MSFLPTVANNGLGQTIRLRAATVSFRALGLASCTFALLPDHYESYQILPLRPVLFVICCTALERFDVCDPMTAMTLRNGSSLISEHETRFAQH